MKQTFSRLCLWLICLAAALVPLSSAAALVTDQHLSISSPAIAALDGQLFILEDGQALYRLNPGEALEQAKRLDLPQPVDRLMSDGSELFGLSLEQGSLYAIDTDIGNMQQLGNWPMQTLLSTGDGGRLEPASALMRDNVLYLAIGGDRAGLAAFYPDGKQDFFTLPGKTQDALVALKGERHLCPRLGRQGFKALSAGAWPPGTGRQPTRPPMGPGLA